MFQSLNFWTSQHENLDAISGSWRLVVQRRVNPAGVLPSVFSVRSVVEENRLRRPRVQPARAGEEPLPRPCAFCEIVARRADALTVWEDAATLAFLDRRPLFPGHCLLVPKEHVWALPELPDELVLPLFSAAKRLARAVEEGMGAQGTFVAMTNRVSQSVRHLHVHVVPRTRGDGLRGFFWPRAAYPDEAAARRAQTAIREALERLRGA
ncbi:MAG: HIT family protein [Deltaproteobacteria bacterium]|nr:HIT family protein [Deltaproteobacteria bacterium]